MNIMMRVGNILALLVATIIIVTLVSGCQPIQPVKADEPPATTTIIKADWIPPPSPTLEFPQITIESTGITQTAKVTFTWTITTPLEVDELFLFGALLIDPTTEQQIGNTLVQVVNIPEVNLTLTHLRDIDIRWTVGIVHVPSNMTASFAKTKTYRIR